MTTTKQKGSGSPIKLEYRFPLYLGVMNPQFVRGAPHHVNALRQRIAGALGVPVVNVQCKGIDDQKPGYDVFAGNTFLPSASAQRKRVVRIIHLIASEYWSSKADVLRSETAEHTARGKRRVQEHGSRTHRG